MFGISDGGLAPASASLARIGLVARIALGVGALCVAVLLLTLFAATHDSGASYLEVIRSHAITRRNLGLALWIAGCIVVSAAGVLTWMVALYASFRIAGPFYRLSRNLELELAAGPVPPVPIRRTDALQRESHELGDAACRLHSHYAELKALARGARVLLGHDEGAAAEPLRRIEELDARVSL